MVIERCIAGSCVLSVSAKGGGYRRVAAVVGRQPSIVRVPAAMFGDETLFHVDYPSELN
jgi:hypothetical protein